MSVKVKLTEPLGGPVGDHQNPPRMSIFTFEVLTFLVAVDQDVGENRGCSSLSYDSKAAGIRPTPIPFWSFSYNCSVEGLAKCDSCGLSSALND